MLFPHWAAPDGTTPGHFCHAFLSLSVQECGLAPVSGVRSVVVEGKPTLQLLDLFPCFPRGSHSCLALRELSTDLCLLPETQPWHHHFLSPRSALVTHLVIVCHGHLWRLPQIPSRAIFRTHVSIQTQPATECLLCACSSL